MTYVGSNIAGSFSTETLGTVTLVNGASFISSVTGGTNTNGSGMMANLIVTTLSRNQGTTVDFLTPGSLGINQPLNSAFNKILINSFGTSPTNAGLVNGILPYAAVQNSWASPARAPSTSMNSPPASPPASAPRSVSPSTLTT